MGKESTIEWTDATWNPVTGCTKVSAGCKNCYAETFAERWRGIPGHPYEQGFDLRLWDDRLKLPLQWKRPRKIFVNSMSDLFHEDVPFEFIEKVFATMEDAHWHTFQVLTKRPERMFEYSKGRSWPDNVWAGTSVENVAVIYRIERLCQTKAKTRFLSIEPLIGPLPDMKFYLDNIDWVIVGGESGPGARPMDIEWVRDIRDACMNADVPFFMKQLGSVTAKQMGVKGTKGGDLLELPKDLQLREMPHA